MILIVFLLGSVSLAAATEYTISDPGVVIDATKKLVSIIVPSTDLDLSGLGLFSLDSDAFANCTSLKTLDLSDNSLKNLPKDVFSPLKNLEHLTLARNNLDSKGMERAFLHLTNLKSLDITHNPLSRILENEDFVGLTNSCEIYVDASTNFRTITPFAFGKKPEQKNRTIAVEVKNCPNRLDDRIEMFKIEGSYDWTSYRSSKGYNIEDVAESDDVKMCMNSTTVGLVDFGNVTDTASPNCYALLIQDGTRLMILEKTITFFEKGWFRIRNTSIKAIYMRLAKFENLTSDLLNDLPEDIKFFSLHRSHLKHLPKGVMVNEHLRGLNLAMNWISFIEENAFAGMKLTRLHLRENPIVTLDYVMTLPDTLLWLDIGFTLTREIPVGSFSPLKNLLALNLNSNYITEMMPGSFRGLVSLQLLDISIGKVTNLRPNAFRHLSRLYRLDLHRSNISRLEKGAFNDLGCLTELDLTVSHLKTIDEGAFDGLTDSLEVMDLHHNEIEILPIGTFVGGAKLNLSLQENKIRKIEKGTFDLPYLINLDLRINGLTTIEKGAIKNLGNLADKIEIKLGFNNITRLENGALGGLPSNAHVSLPANPLRVIEAGVFDDS